MHMPSLKPGARKRGKKKMKGLTAMVLPLSNLLLQEHLTLQLAWCSLLKCSRALAEPGEGRAPHPPLPCLPSICKVGSLFLFALASVLTNNTSFPSAPPPLWAINLWLFQPLMGLQCSAISLSLCSHRGELQVLMSDSISSTTRHAFTNGSAQCFHCPGSSPGSSKPPSTAHLSPGLL